MRFTKDCSQKISGEHYISAAILAEFGDLRVSGLPWFGPGDALIGPGALRANILCTKHNSALSPLDTEGRRALVGVRNCLDHVFKRSLSRKPLFRIASGEALELWALKTLMGLLHANVARTEGEPTAKFYSLDEHIILTALTGGGLPQGCGLYVGQDSDVLDQSIGVAPITEMRDRQVAGLRVSFMGIVFDVLLDPDAASYFGGANQPKFQPIAIDINGPERTGRIILTWMNRRTTGSRVGMQVRRLK
jgi:hypothetical protein